MVLGELGMLLVKIKLALLLLVQEEEELFLLLMHQIAVMLPMSKEINDKM
jgi:hypothetical protein